MRLHIAPSPDNVRAARDAVSRFAGAMGMGAERREEVALAVSEAVTNAFAAQREADSEGTVTVVAQLGGDGALEVTVADAGVGFEPQAARERSERSLEARRNGATEGGYGLTVMEGLVDRIEFQGGCGTTVRMGFRT